ncbi:hypothetical protein, variant [Saprolegnia diclina VS20]|uniref:RING-type domain-containing protein n=1 Tax=Saprolegnia diclina (strain VS20) TaxID=1156394 RepID=T0RF86_SAPDV|nr:hypothetical protein, variant [Saprolegnia diclina VS20]XP_008618213.1 hypothetical protein SDRG_13890 [Saprolegnia diclina VS20]EQC28342.1 hypothetical protein SDRG_13890 [Saprolegnia diclina VS20]EQC28343.1 hypothetical protein, variant [Saprolegnia diclina VS20]|eukprot:XP_008618212.1 hypothetical protein, variant [Saprolegnia diclina VS20]
MEAAVLGSMSRLSDSVSLYVKDAFWVFVVFMVCCLGELSIPILLVIVYIFHRHVIHQRHRRWLDLPEACRDEILAITATVSPRPPDMTNDLEWFGQSEHFTASLHATMANLRANNPRMPFARDFFSAFDNAVSAETMAYAQWNLLRTTDRYLGFQDTKVKVEVMVQHYQSQKQAFEEQVQAKREALRLRLRRELKWKRLPEDDWEEDKGNWFKKVWKLWAPPKPPKAEPTHAPVVASDDDACCICLEEYDGSKELIQAKCAHIFHEDCLLEWLRQNSTNKCPYCRAPILKPTFLQQFFQ